MLPSVEWLMSDSLLAMRNRDEVANQTRSVVEKVNLIRQIDVQAYHDTGVLLAGDVGAVYGLNQARIGDFLGTGANVHIKTRLNVACQRRYSKDCTDGK